MLDFDVLFGRTDLNEIAQHRAFNGCALVYDLIHDIQIDGGDDGALAGNDLHKAVLFQPLQGSAHRCARNAEPFAQLIFADGLSGLDLQRNDLIFQRLVDASGCSCSAMCSHSIYIVDDKTFLFSLLKRDCQRMRMKYTIACIQV